MKILLVQLGKIGDAVLMTPLIREIALNIPDAEIHVIVSSKAAPVYKDNPNIKKLLIYKKNPVSLFLIFIYLFINKYEWLIDPKDHYSKESAFIAKICKAEKSIGYNLPDKINFMFLVNSEKQNQKLHAVERNLLCLKYLGIDKKAGLLPQLFPDSTIQKEIQKTFLLHKNKNVLINISSGNSSRNWQIEHFIKVSEYCISKKFSVFITFKPADKKYAKIIGSYVSCVNIFNSPTICYIIALMPFMHLVITPDTSIVHIASAFNIPQVALFPDIEWNYYKFRPLSSKHAVIMPQKGKNISTIPPERVIEEIEKIIG
jgi:ADP-heptose:LPS heptosyltransferase